MNDDCRGFFDYTPPPPPKPGSPVFGPRDQDWPLNACLNYVDSESKWSWYSDGYKVAGDRLVGYAEENNRDQDILVFPIVFNYRQYLEVRLKELLMLLCLLRGEAFDLPTHHDLLVLWAEVKPRLLREFPGEKHVPGVEHVLKEFAKVDVGSFAFRYPVAKDGKSPSLAGKTHINLGQVRDRIAEVAPILDGAAYGLRDWLDQKREFDAEMRAEYAAEMGEY